MPEPEWADELWRRRIGVKRGTEPWHDDLWSKIIEFDKEYEAEKMIDKYFLLRRPTTQGSYETGGVSHARVRYGDIPNR